jgi:hypothetical protein
MKRNDYYVYTVANRSNNIYNSCKSSIDFELNTEGIKGIEGYIKE